MAVLLMVAARTIKVERKVERKAEMPEPEVVGAGIQTTTVVARPMSDFVRERLQANTVHQWSVRPNHERPENLSLVGQLAGGIIVSDIVSVKPPLVFTEAGMFRLGKADSAFVAAVAANNGQLTY
jgi:hypothetical protein